MKVNKRLTNKELAERMKGAVPPLCACGECDGRVTWDVQGRKWRKYRRGHYPRSQAVLERLRIGICRGLGVPDEPVNRFWSKVDRSIGSDACWIWKAYRDKKGYGLVNWEGQSAQKAHRVAWQIAYGPIPDGMYILHHCDNPSCVNPEHLWLGTHRDNMRDMVAKGRQATGDDLHVPRGSACSWAKLDEEKVKEIRRLAAEIPRKDIAKRFGVAYHTVSDIINRKIWKHVE